MTTSAPTRSAYSENVFENDVDTSSSTPGRTSSSRPGRVLAQPVAEPLVGEVDQRQQPSRLHDIPDLPPQVRRRIHARRVVARAVEEHDVAGRGALERGQQRRSVDGPPGSIRVRVRPDAEAGGVEQLRVVRPRRLAHPQRPAGPRLLQEVRGHPQAAGPAGRLRGERPPRHDRLVVGAEDEGTDELAVGDLAVDRPVELRAGRIGEPSLGLDHGREDRRRPRFVHEHARRQVDLPGACVRAIRLGETEDRVGRGGDAGERREGHENLERSGDCRQ